MRPLGSPGARKLQDVLVDAKVPAAARAGTPLVVCDGRVIWVCGLVVAEEGRITRETTGIVRLGMGRNASGGAPELSGGYDGTAGREGDG